MPANLIPVTFISYNFTGTQQAWSATERELYAIYVTMHKLSYMIKGSKVTVRTDHKPLLGIVTGTAKAQNTVAADKFRQWTSDILARDPHSEIEYKKGLLNLIADSLLRLRMGEHYQHNIPLHNTEPIILKKKAKVNMVITHAKSAEHEQLTPKLLDLQIRIRDTFKTSDKCQLIMNPDKVLDSLDPAKLRGLQDTDQSIINLKNSRKQSVIADNNSILRIKVDDKGNTVEAILLPKVLRPWILASTHEFCGHQGRDHCYYKKATYFWNGMKNDIYQAISSCKICKIESPNLGKYMSLHLEIGAAPMHFLTMDTIEIRDADSAYKYAFILIDMLTNYMFVIPVKDICRKTLVHEYIYKVYLPFRRMEKFIPDNGTSFINEDWKNLAKALSFCHIQSSPRNPRANGCIKNVHNFLKRTMKKIRHGNKSIKWPKAIQIAVHNYNTFPSASNGHSPFLLHFRRECSNPLWNKLSPGNTVIRQGNITTSMHELHKLWKAHTAEIRKNRSKNDNTKIDKDPPLKIGDRVLIMNYNSHGLDLKFFGDWKIWKFNFDRQVIVQNQVGDFRILSTRHMKRVTHDDIICSTCDLLKPSWKL